MQLLNSKNGSAASSFSGASAHTHPSLPPSLSLLRACSFHPSPLSPSIAWGPCSLSSLSLSLSYTFNTPPPSCLFLRPFHHAHPPTPHPLSCLKSDLVHAFPHQFKDSLICTAPLLIHYSHFILRLSYSNTKEVFILQTIEESEYDDGTDL